jgi:hypothetical protein
MQRAIRRNGYRASSSLWIPRNRRAFGASIWRRFAFGIFDEPHPTRIVVLAILDLRQDEEQILKRLARR